MAKIIDFLHYYNKKQVVFHKNEAIKFREGVKRYVPDNPFEPIKTILPKFNTNVFIKKI